MEIQSPMLLAVYKITLLGSRRVYRQRTVPRRPVMVRKGEHRVEYHGG